MIFTKSYQECFVMNVSDLTVGGTILSRRSNVGHRKPIGRGRRRSRRVGGKIESVEGHN